MKTFSQFINEQLLLEIGMFARLHHKTLGMIELDNTAHSDERKQRKEQPAQWISDTPVDDSEIESLVRYCFETIMDDYQKNLIQKDNFGCRNVILRDYRNCVNVALGMYLGQERFSPYNNRYGVNKIFVKTVMRGKNFSRGNTKWIIDVLNDGKITHTRPVVDDSGYVLNKENPACWDETTQTCGIKKEKAKEPMASGARKALADWLANNN